MSATIDSVYSATPGTIGEAYSPSISADCVRVHRASFPTYAGLSGSMVASSCAMSRGTISHNGCR